jgi:hypothetical protein
MSAKRGENNQRSKLTEVDVFVLRALVAIGYSPYLLAKIFDVSRPHVKRVARGEKWSWLT